MSPLPPDIAKIRDELAEEHKLLTKDNGIESSNYHFKAGFNAAAEIFLKREAETKQEAGALVAEAIYMDGKINKLQANNESLRKYGLEQFRLAQKLQARNDKLVEALRKIAVDKPRNSIDEAQDYIDIAEAALAANKEQA